MGAGHDAVAAELGRRLRAAGHETAYADVLALLPGHIGDGLRRFYHGTIRHAPLVYAGIYAAFFRAGESPAPPADTAAGPVAGRVPRPGTAPLAALAEKTLSAEVARARADAVVPVFHLAAQLTGLMRGRGTLTVPSAVVITDFALHRQWLHSGNDLHLCLTEDIARRVRGALGRPAVATGPLVPDRFHPHPPGEQAWRAHLASGGAPPVLLSAGAWGTGRRLASTARLLAGAGGYLPVVLCGRDAGLRRRVARLPHVRALGWVRDMPGLMAASAALVDNAAGQTAVEALAVGLPVVGFRALPGHGVEGVRHMASLGLVDHALDAWQLLQCLDRLTPPGPVRERRTADARRIFGADPVGPLERLIAG